MSEIAVPSTYSEPTVIWRMRHADGRSAQAVIDPMNSGMRVLWFVNDQPLYVRYFADWTDAIEWTCRLRTQQWTVGWRLSDDITEDPPVTNRLTAGASAQEGGSMNRDRIKRRVLHLVATGRSPNVAPTAGCETTASNSRHSPR